MMNIRRVLIGIGVIGLIAFFVFLWEDLGKAWQLLSNLEWQYLLLVVPILGVSFAATTMFYYSFFGSLGYSVSFLHLLKMNLSLVFANVALPSAGISAISLMAYSLKREGVPSGKATLAQFARYGLTYASFIILLGMAMAALYFGDNIAKITIRITLLLTISIVILSLLIVYALYDQRAFNWLVRKVQELIDWIGRRFRQGRELIGQDRIERLLHEFHDGFMKIMRNRLYLRQPFGWALLGNFAEVAVLYVVFVALGTVLNPGVVIIAYAIASASGFLTVIPGDIGVYEAVMVAVLATAGVPFALAVSATLLYRVTAKVVLLPFGFYFYNQQINQDPNAASH